MDEEHPITNVAGVEMVSSEAIRDLNKFLSERLARVAGMTELLMAKGFTSQGKKDAIVLETDQLEAHQVKQLLLDNGYGLHEFEMRMEYTRAWGIL